MTTTLLQFAPVLSSWMIVAGASSAMLALVALALHRLARGAVPSRVVWGIALLVSAALTFTQPLRRAPAPLPIGPMTAATPATAVVAAEPTLFETLTGPLFRTNDAVMSRVHALGIAAADAARRAPVAAQFALLLLWPLATLTLLTLGAWIYRRQHQAMRHARTQKVAGYDVHVTDAFGPAVFGAVRPRVVVPHWLLGRPAEEQRLVLLHEQSQHRGA